MKKLTALLLAGAMVFSLAACGGGSAPAASTPAASAPAASAPAASAPAASTPAASDADYSALEPVVLMGADNASRGAAGQLLGEAVAEKLDEITGGQLTMEYFPNGELGGDADLIRQMNAGDLGIVVCQIAPMVSFVPTLAVFDAPMEFYGYDGAAISAVLNNHDGQLRQTLDKAYNDAKLQLLGFLQNNTYRLTTANVELNTLADFKGLHIRTMENSNHMAFWRAIGAEPNPLAWGETYISLQNHTVDAQENAADTIIGNNLQEVQKYLCNTQHILYLNQICINKDIYDGLDPLYQEALQMAVDQAIAEIEPQLPGLDSDMQAELESKGMTIITYPDSFYEEVLALPEVQALYKDIDGQVNGLVTTMQSELEAAAG